MVNNNDTSSRADTLAKRRLRSLLISEDYGEKLARLPPAQSNRVLELVSENRMREARALIIQLDEERRHVRTAQRKHQKARGSVLDQLQGITPAEGLMRRSHLIKKWQTTYRAYNVQILVQTEGHQGWSPTIAWRDDSKPSDQTIVNFWRDNQMQPEFGSDADLSEPTAARILRWGNGYTH
jgi:hypothetical protein